jgi:hypothetical protein
MISPVNNSLAPNQTSQTTSRQAQPQQNNALPQDTVSLKSTGDADHDGDSK